jgi:1-deoxy-D-xylulose-5-phosphate synthase
VPLKQAPVVIETGRAETVRQGEDVVIWALGPMVAEAQRLAERLEDEEKVSCGVVNARFVKPLDETLLKRQAAEGSRIVTMEDHVLSGGFGSAVLEALESAGFQVPVERIGWPDAFVDHGSSVDELRAAHGLDFESILERLRDFLKPAKAAPGVLATKE